MQMLIYLDAEASVITLGLVLERFSVPKIHLITLTPSVEINPITPNTVPKINVRTIMIIVIIQKKYNKYLNHWTLQQQA